MAILDEIRTLASVLGINLNVAKGIHTPYWIERITTVFNNIATGLPQWANIFSLSDLNTAWSSQFNKIFDMTTFNTAWSSQLNKIFNFSEVSSWLTDYIKTNTDKIFNLTEYFAAMTYSNVKTVYTNMRNTLVSDFVTWLNKITQYAREEWD